MSPQSRRATYLIARAERAATFLPIDVSVLSHVANLQRAIRLLCSDLAVLHGDDATPARGCQIEELPLGISRAMVEFIYTAEDGATIERVLVNGAWVSCDEFDDDTISTWRNLLDSMAAANHRESA